MSTGAPSKRFSVSLSLPKLFVTRILAVAAAVLCLALPAGATDMVGTGALLQGLDKVTARISTFEAPLDTPVRFGTLEITVHRCLKHPPEEPPESAALMEIREIRRASRRCRCSRDGCSHRRPRSTRCSIRSTMSG